VIIAVVSQKGGTGKTTIATNLAACYAAQGREVMLVDADPQHSALDWKADRPSTLPSVHALHLPEKNLFQEVQHLRQKYELLIIDGGGRITATARAAVAAADFLIIPTLPSKFDLLSTGLCTRPLRIIILPPKPGKMPPTQPDLEGQGHGLTSFLLPTCRVGTRMALRSIACHWA